MCLVGLCRVSSHAPVCWHERKENKERKGERQKERKKMSRERDKEIKKESKTREGPTKERKSISVLKLARNYNLLNHGYSLKVDNGLVSFSYGL